MRIKFIDKGEMGKEGNADHLSEEEFFCLKYDQKERMSLYPLDQFLAFKVSSQLR